MKCENCGKISVHRFCSDKCRKSFSTKFDNKNETKDVECIKIIILNKYQLNWEYIKVSLAQG